MTPARYTVGIDFGTESGRAVLIDVADGVEAAAAVVPYSNGVIDEHLPAPFDEVVLEPEWALQDPDDYLQVIAQGVPAALAKAGISAEQVIGVGIDFTSCTMLPTTADGTPLCKVEDLRSQPHSWPKLWKHHAAQPEADRINALGGARGETWLARYGGKYSSEWFFSKALQILDEAPEIYARAERLIEAADWIVWQLTGAESRNNCTAGYKAMWIPEVGFPSDEFFAALDPRFEHVVDEKLSRTIAPLGARVGGLSARAAEMTGLPEGTPVAAANVDAHVSAPAVGAVSSGTMVIIMGTSNCHILLGDDLQEVGGMCGVVADGVVPGLYGYEAGQSGVGDIFAWFAEQAVPHSYFRVAEERGVDVHDVLEEEAARLRPGESGLLALDWWNGNRSVLVDTELSGLIVGLTLASRAPEIYRALLEATAFGTRTIIDALESSGVPVEHVIACGGLPHRNRLLMQIYADVTGRTFKVSSSLQTPALGAAMHAAVAAGAGAGGYKSITEAAPRMAAPLAETFEPDPDAHAVYSRLHAEYMRLHDQLGRDPESPMKRVWRLRHEVLGGGESLGLDRGPAD